MALELIAFISRKRAEEIGIRVENVVSPYDIWRHEGLGVVFHMRRNSDQEPQKEFEKYRANPDYLQKIVYCGN